MRALLICGFTFSFLLVSNSFAETPTDSIQDAIKTKLMNQTFNFTTDTKETDSQGDTYDSKFSRRWTFGNFESTNAGIKFGASINITQTNTYAKPAGEPVVRVRDRNVTVAYELKKLKTSGEYAGFMRYTLNTGAENPDPTGNMQSVRVSLADGKLTLVQKDVTPIEVLHGADGKLTTLLCENTDVIDIESTPRKRKFTEQCHEVDPKTFEKLKALAPYVIEESAL